jgi:hypothetical protein
MRILYKFPSRQRPYKFFAAIDNIISMSRHDDYQILCTLDIDDATMTTPAVRDKLATYEKVKPYWGFSGSKIASLNRDIPLADPFDIICVHSDDMVFLKEGFDLDILDGFADGFRGLLHFPDGHADSRLITYPIMHVDYYKRFNYIYHPSYFSVFGDNEQHEVAVKLGQYKFVDKKILDHAHPIWGKAEFDNLYRKNEEPTQYARDGETYRKRKAINFGL